MIGDLCRHILSQYHEAGISRFSCAAYVRHHEGQFFVIPFGECRRLERYPWVALPIFTKGAFPEWVFEAYPYRFPWE